MKRIFLAICLILSLNSSLFAQSQKKGLAIGEAVPFREEIIYKTRVSWFYNWSCRTKMSTDAEFVPMVWGRYRDDFLEKCFPEKKQKYVLLFNEPDHKKQSNISVDEAISLSQDEIFHGMTVVSPAPANALGIWMQSYMKKVRENNINFEFIAVHWYGPPEANKFLSYIDKVFSLYKKPIWITEFSVADWNVRDRGPSFRKEDAISFMKEVLPELERRQSVFRYSWFSDAKNRPELGVLSSLWDPNTGLLTELGQIYSEY